MIFESVDELSVFAQSLNPTEQQISQKKVRRNKRWRQQTWQESLVCRLSVLSTDRWLRTHTFISLGELSTSLCPRSPPFPSVLFALPLWTALARPPNDLQQCVRNASNKHWQDSSWERLLAASLTAAFRKRWHLGLEIEPTHASHPSLSCQTKSHHTTRHKWTRD